MPHYTCLIPHVPHKWSAKGAKKAAEEELQMSEEVEGFLGRVLAWLLPSSIEITADAYTRCVSSQCTVCGIFLNQSHPHMLMMCFLYAPGSWKHSYPPWASTHTALIDAEALNQEVVYGDAAVTRNLHIRSLFYPWLVVKLAFLSD